CNPDGELSFPGFGGACGGGSTGMAYLKSAPYPVPGLGLHGLPVDSLHSSMGYPGGKSVVIRMNRFLNVNFRHSAASDKYLT
ncbi:hypothetical protein QE152_g22211, partial [Popillia japonica]